MLIFSDDALGVEVGHGDVFGEDGDAAFAFEGVVVEDELSAHDLGAEHAGLAEHGVDEGGFAVVDVSDDGDVAEFVATFLGGHRGLVMEYEKNNGAVSRAPGSSALYGNEGLMSLGDGKVV